MNQQLKGKKYNQLKTAAVQVANAESIAQIE
jgi:hypothetical protein